MTLLRLIIATSFLAISSISFTQEDDGFSFFLSLENHSFSEPTSINSFIHEFDGDLENGEYAFINNTAEVGVRFKNWSISYINRYDNFYSFSNDLARFYYETEHNLAQPTNQPYEISLEANHIRAKGLKIGYDWSLKSNFTLRSKLSYLQASEIYDGQMQGAIELLSSNNYSGQLNLNLFSHKDVVLNYPFSQTPEGRGYAVDIGFDWQINEPWLLAMELKDAHSTIDWLGALNSEFFATTAIKSFDADGQLNVTPSLSGIQSANDFKQTLPKKLNAELSYQLDDRYGISAQVFHTEYFTHKTLAYHYALNDNNLFIFSWGVDTQALGIEYLTQFGRFGISTDNLNYEDSHTINIIFELNITL